MLSLISQDERVRTLIRNDYQLKKISTTQFQRLKNARICESVHCYTDLLRWSDREIMAVGNELIRLFLQKKAIRKFIAGMRKRDYYPLYKEKPDTALLRRAWNDVANGINHIIDVYINGEMPRYPKIDSISFKRGDTNFKNRIGEAIQKIASENDKQPFYEFSLQLALEALKLNGREEAAWYEPLPDGLNRQPYLKIKTTDFSDYPYSVILIPGLGPEIPGMALDPRGARRCESGVLRYKKGLAPFIVVSGGNVHPFRTPFNEAVEMKKYIVEKLGIPADVVLIEPHARHTTTNIRNTSRMIYRFGIPYDKPVLIVTDSSQAAYITGRMSATAKRDLGYLPMQQVRVLNEEEVEFYPVKHSLQADPFDPLDP